ncbi:MAG TPA: hypothetical protein VIA06_08435 [Candidatus Dormibacteraeota bacterium]|jgi:hypothetical protein|nr:hypothetical protein [Candidatus Dormibacteraeota bacterium]
MILPKILERIQKMRERRAAGADAKAQPPAVPGAPPGAPPAPSRRRSKRKAPAPAELGKLLEVLGGICFCVLYDLCCWLAEARQPVPANVQKYSLTHLKAIPDPRQRLQYYVNPMVLASWDQVLQPFFATDLRLAPELGDSASLTEEGLDKGDAVRVEMRFQNRCSVAIPGNARKPLPRGEWVMTLWISDDLTRVDDVVLRPREPDPES